MKKTIILIAGLFFIVLISLVYADLEVSFQPNATNATDVRIDAGQPDTPYGNSLYLTFGSGSEFPNRFYRTLFNWNFTCDSIPTGSAINNVDLRLISTDVYEPANATVYPLNCSYARMSVTWNNCGAGGCVGCWNTSYVIGRKNTGTMTMEVPFNISLDPSWYQQECAKSSNQRRGFIIIGMEISGQDKGVMGPYSSNYAVDTSKRPMLYVNYTIAGDSTPPTISNLNCTSCDIPNGDTTEPYETEDTTPTFKFNTNENAWCAVGVSDVNYTTMGASRNCTSGEGIQSHICTLTTQDKFTSVGVNYLYISCKDNSGNEGNVSNHSKSNSGSIRMEIEGASETSGDDAIQIGITTSEIGATATIYSSQRVSARNLANNQFTGIFDKVAVNDNKRWAFNYISAGESQITGLFNLTPVLYVLQLQNQTNETITDQVGKLINST